MAIAMATISHMDMSSRKQIFRLLSVIVLLWIVNLTEAWTQTPDYQIEYLEDDCQPYNEGEDGQAWDSRVIYALPNDTSSLYGYVKVTPQLSYSNGLNCAIKLQAPDGYRVTIRIPRIEIYHDDDPKCDDNYMSIIGATSSKHYCGFGTVASSIYSTASWLIFRIKTRQWDATHDYIGFSLYYTALRPGPCDDKSPNRTEYECRYEKYCTPRELLCDNRDNCGDWSDERVNVCGLTQGATIAIAVVCTLVGGTTIFFIAYCVYTKHKDRRIRERRQQEINPTMSMAYNNNGPRVSTLTPAVGANGRMAEPPPPYTPAAYINEGVFNGGFPDTVNGTIPTEGGYDTIPGDYPGQVQNQVPGEQISDPNTRNMRVTTLSSIRPAIGEPPPVYVLNPAAEGDCGIPASAVSYDALPQKNN